MKATITFTPFPPPSPSPSPPYYYTPKSIFQPLHITSSLPTRRSKNPTKNHPTETIHLQINLPSPSKFLKSSQTNLTNFLNSGTLAFHDLKTLVTFDNDNRRIVLSCRRSSLNFLANFLAFSALFVVAVTFFVKFVRGSYGGVGGGGFVWRRDRSLAGRQVAVQVQKRRNSRVLVRSNPLSITATRVRNERDLVAHKKKSVSEAALPKWWSSSVRSSYVPLVNKEEAQKEASRLIRAIVDNRMNGKDISEDDIIQLRRICKTSGLRVYIETTNARDSFYRSSVEFLLNSCCSSMSHSSTVHTDVEDARQFVTGLADIIGLQEIRAVRIVCGSVAARTRSWFLQAWALEMQHKRAEAIMELSKICLLHQIFPPEEGSPEIEMVARGLETHLRMEQREHLLNLFVGICSAGRRSAEEALGLKGRHLVIEDVHGV